MKDWEARSTATKSVGSVFISVYLCPQKSQAAFGQHNLDFGNLLDDAATVSRKSYSSSWSDRMLSTMKQGLPIRQQKWINLPAIIRSSQIFHLGQLSGEARKCMI
jgi:hypothetical protein